MIVEEYDPQTDRWVRKADMPTKRAFCSASVVDGKIYVMGGYETRDRAVSTVEEYNPVTDTWTGKADMLSPNARFSASTVDGKIYAIGGASNFSGKLFQWWSGMIPQPMYG